MTKKRGKRNGAVTADEPPKTWTDACYMYSAKAGEKLVYHQSSQTLDFRTKVGGEPPVNCCVAVIPLVCLSESNPMRSFTALASAVALTVSPVIAAPAFAAPVNAASSLSVAKARVGTATSSKKNGLAGGGAIAAALLAAGVAAIGIVAIVNDSNDSDSN
ncbi:hypothetical protein [Sphingomonas mollis]